MIKLTTLDGHPLWVRKDAIEIVEDAHVHLYDGRAKAFVTINGSIRAIAETPERVLALL